MKTRNSQNVFPSIHTFVTLTGNYVFFHATFQCRCTANISGLQRLVTGDLSEYLGSAVSEL